LQSGCALIAASITEGHLLAENESTGEVGDHVGRSLKEGEAGGCGGNVKDLLIVQKLPVVVGSEVQEVVIEH